jgi:hypothetical protein
MTENPHLFPLTPAVVMDLRVSMSMRGSSDGTNDRIGVPFLVYSPSEDAFVLHAYGSPQAMHADPRVLAQVMRCERAEAGFIRRILSAQEPCDVATLSPDARARYAHTQAAEAARRRLLAQEAAETLSRRASHIDPAKLSLDDL